MTAHELTATVAAEAIRERRLSSEELVRSCLERIEAREGEVRAWVHLDADYALAQARERDAAPAHGPLHGVPVAVKDIIDTADLPTSYGTPVYDGHRPAEDAACVARLRAAGAVVLGKTVTTELALFSPGPTRNPHDLARTPGGSSSGSAAAVADRMVPLALGTQTAGSIVRPAAFCGVGGCKPTLGAVPVDGVKPAAPSLDTVGPFARTSEDLALCLGVLAGERVELPALPERPRVALLRTPWWDLAAETTRQAIEAAVERLAASVDVDELALPAECAALMDAQIALMEAEVATSLAAERRDHGDLLSASLRERIDRGAAVPDAERLAALVAAERWRPEIDALLDAFDVVISPAAVGEAPDLASTGDPVLCRPWTLLGNPTIAVPGLRGPAGLPLGVQVVAPRGQDARALAAAAWLAPRLERQATAEAERGGGSASWERPS